MRIFVLIVLVFIMGIVLMNVIKKNQSRKSERTLIKNVHLIDGNGNEYNNYNVLIKNGIIAQISEKEIPIHNAKVIEAEGKTLIPGLIDSHTHMQGTTNRSEEESDEFLENRVQSIFMNQIFPYGITTIKELGSPRSFIYKLKDKINSGQIIGPNLLIVGPNITAKEGHPAITLGGDNPWVRKELAAEVSTEEEARQIVRELAEHKVDFLKIVYQGGQYFYFDTELYIQKLDIRLVNIIIEEGNKYNLKVSAHVRNKSDVIELLHTHIYGIDHGITDADIDDTDPVLELWKRQGAYYVPTINALAFEHDKTLFGHSMHNLKIIYDAGIKIVLGTDNMLEILSGDVVHKELSHYVEAGLSEMEAIVTATHNGAEYLGILERTGTIEVGKDADLVLLNSNPLANIKNIEDIEMVWKKGKKVFAKNENKKIVLPNYDFGESASLCYRDELHKKEKRTGNRQVMMKQSEGMCSVEVSYNYENDAIIQESFVCEQSLITNEWNYENVSGGSKLHAVCKDNIVSLSGVFKNKSIDRQYDVTGKLWMQMGEINLSSFAKSQEDEIHYFAIGTGDNRGALEMTEFTSKKEGIETVEISGTSYECQKISTVITKYAFIWTGYGWYEKESGKLLKYAAKGNETDALVIL